MSDLTRDCLVIREALAQLDAAKPDNAAEPLDYEKVWKQWSRDMQREGHLAPTHRTRKPPRAA